MSKAGPGQHGLVAFTAKNITLKSSKQWFVLPQRTRHRPLTDEVERRKARVTPETNLAAAEPS
jgi:hypothetical protein